MNRFMTLPSKLMEELSANEMVSIHGGDNSPKPAVNEKGYTCTGANMAGIHCNGANAGGISCGE